MPTVRFICLANSQKLGGRCIAGLRVDGRGWIRPVSESPTGELYPRHYRLQDGSEPQLLDLLEIDFDRPAPERHQPENFLIAGRSWRLVERPVHRKYIRLLDYHLVQGPELFGNNSDRVASATFTDTPAECSLVLVEPEDLRWYITDDIKGRRQTRSLFKLYGQHYKLVITDISWQSRINHLEYGTYPFTEAGMDGNQRIILTISLGEPFGGQCYKLVAAVITMPA